MALKSLTRLAIPTLALSLALAACSGSKPAADASGTATGDASAATLDAGATIEAREDNFKALGKAMKANKAALDTASPDFDAIASTAAGMVENAQKVPTLFPAGTGPESGEKTEALATIWERPEDFQKAATKLIEATRALGAAARDKNLDATKAAFGNVGMACKGCHDDFRKEEKH